MTPLSVDQLMWELCHFNHRWLRTKEAYWNWSASNSYWRNREACVWHRPEPFISYSGIWGKLSCLWEIPAWKLRFSSKKFLSVLESTIVSSGKGCWFGLNIHSGLETEKSDCLPHQDPFCYYWSSFRSKGAGGKKRTGLKASSGDIQQENNGANPAAWVLMPGRAP